VLTSITIGMALAVLATTAFFQVQAIMRRTEARLRMHNSARFLYQALRSDLLALQQDGAMWIETSQDSGAGDGDVRLTFLRGKQDTMDYDVAYGYGAYNSVITDLVWTQWKWDQRHRALCCGSSTPVRTWNVGVDWIAPGPLQVNFKNHHFRNMPQPQRVAGTNAATTLDSNRYGSPDPHDIGDYADLAPRVTPVARDITRFDLEVVLNDGSTVRADTSAARTVPLDGCYVDARDPATGTKPNLRRPRLFRVRFEMTDPELKLTQSFSFSFRAPSPLPPYP
jgi:hypothetical protein